MKAFFYQLLHEFQTPIKSPVLIFSIILLIILLAPILLKRMRLPGIIGLIVSGIIVGPNGLNLLAKNDAINLFSTIGLLYIMFIAGLELDLVQFRKNRHKSFLFGFFTFFFPIALGLPVCYYFLGYDFNAAALTASMFATHTLVTYPIVSKLGISKNEAVAIAVGGTILTDTAVLLILAVIKGNASVEGLSLDFWMHLLIGLTIFSFFMFFLVPRLTKWFFKNLESEKHSHYIYVLAVVFFAAFLAEVGGVEPIIGAFVAGLVLNPLIPHSSALMNRIEYVGNALFIPFFLISVGMLVDLSTILNGYTALLVAATLTIVALLGKWIAAFLTQLVFKYSNAQRNLIFGLSSSHAAATIAIILIGYNMKVLDENILNGTIILILITCLVASIVTEAAAKKIVIAKNNENSPQILSSTEKERILIPIANFNNFEKLLDFAIILKNKKSKNALTMLSVVPDNASAELNIQQARECIDKVLFHASASESKVEFITTIDYNAGSGIVRSSREVMANIVLIGWPRSKGFFAQLLGETLDLILESTSKLVLVSNISLLSYTPKRIALICPPLVELENNFGLWMDKIHQLANEWGISICVLGKEDSFEAIKKHAKSQRYATKINYEPFSGWSNIHAVSHLVLESDLVVFAGSRNGAISNLKSLDNIPEKLEGLFEEHHKLIIFA